MIRIVRATCDCGMLPAHLASPWPGGVVAKRPTWSDSMAGMVHVVRDESPQAWAEHLAARFASFLADEPAARVALPTGATPEPVYAGIVDPPVRAGIASFRPRPGLPARRIGGVPPDAKGRCDVMLHRSLLDHVDLAPAALPPAGSRSRGSGGDVRGLRRAQCRRSILMVLGIGRNGHVGMNEPGTSPESATRRVNSPRARPRPASGSLRRGRRAADLGRHHRAVGDPRRAHDLDPGHRRQQGRHRPRRAARAGLDHAPGLAAARSPELLAVPRRRRGGEAAGRRAVARLTFSDHRPCRVRVASLPGREAVRSFTRPVDRLLAMTRSSGRTRSAVPSTVRSSARSYSTSNVSRPWAVKTTSIATVRLHRRLVAARRSPRSRIPRLPLPP